MATPRIAETRLAALVISLFRIAAFVALAIAPLRLAIAQAELPPPSQPARGMTLPPVPTRDPRSMEGDWAPKNDQPPLPTFIETLKGNDAAIEVGVGQGRLLTTKHPVQSGAGTRFIAVGDPSIVDFQVLPNPQMVRIIGKRPGVTDLSVTTADNQTYSFEIHVVYGLDLLRAQLKQMFPDADVRLAQIGANIVVEGQARSPAQVSNIIQTIQAHIASQPGLSDSQGSQINTIPAAGGALPTPPAPGDQSMGYSTNAPIAPGTGILPVPSTTGPTNIAGGSAGSPQVINLLTVPGVHQVMLQVSIAELNRTALREIGADLLFVRPEDGTVIGTNIAGDTISALASLTGGGITSAVKAATGSATTAYGIFPSSNFAILLRALRRNSVLSILAEPNLVALSGHRASFLAGGQFPVPVPQYNVGVSSTITVEFKNFGVQLDFVPTVLDDETIRLSVYPEVSTIDFAIGTVLVQGGTPVPGLSTRRTSTTVEMRQGQTLAIAGLLDIELDAQTDRIPFLGDVPYIGPLFSNSHHKKTEKELLVMVTPVLVQPVNCGDKLCLPGADITDPTDCEFYFKERIEGRTGADFRATLSWDHECVKNQVRYEKHHIAGPCGFSE
jgi:pilus assembly protein CpaC